MGPSGRITHVIAYIGLFGTRYAGTVIGRAPRTKETLPDFLKWRRPSGNPTSTCIPRVDG